MEGVITSRAFRETQDRGRANLEALFVLARRDYCPIMSAQEFDIETEDPPQWLFLVRILRTGRQQTVFQENVRCRSEIGKFELRFLRDVEQ